jgi:hypothetical protein
MVTFLPKGNLSEMELKAILAFLNSSFSQLYVETEGRATALGLIALEITQAEQIPIPDVKRMPQSNLRRLAEVFDVLEAAARRVGGAQTLRNIRELDPQFRQIDSTIAQIFGLSDDFVNRTRELVSLLTERRLARTGEATPEILKSEGGTLEIKAPSRKTRVKRGKSDEQATRLDRWSER